MTDLADLITVLVVTSPTASDPSTATIDATIASVEGHLPGVTVSIGCDGVRPSQRALSDAYDEKRFLLAIDMRNTRNQIHVLDHWGHQANVTRMLLEHVTTPLILFMEHDTPLLPVPIDWEGCTELLVSGELDSIRFLHESHILPEHQHLMRGEVDGRVPYIRTSQWSQRPHVARTDWYRNLIHTYFARSSRTMIEDVLYGVVSTAWRAHGLDAWDRYKLAIYADPEPTMQRSDHLDGRAGADKGGMVFAYPGDEWPSGAPAPTLGRIFE